jgi:hypothetical protein
MIYYKNFCHEGDSEKEAKGSKPEVMQYGCVCRSTHSTGLCWKYASKQIYLLLAFTEKVTVE